MAAELQDHHVFGLTGGIGSGKSTVARFLREAGVPVVDADLLARKVVEPGEPGLAAIAKHFGEDVLRPDGSLDRARLGAIVFSDPDARQALEAILHPRIQAAARAEFQRLAAAGEKLICYEVPLLFETEQEERLRPVVVVHVPREAQQSRIVQRDGLDEEAAEKRIDAQLDLDFKAEHADHVIDNTGTLDETRQQTLAVLERIRKSIGVR